MFEELEYKYRADGISYSAFKRLMDDMDNVREKDAASWDVYFTNERKSTSFGRYRGGDTPELTIKTKTEDGNNWRRIEIDLPIDPSRIDEVTVVKFMEANDWKENFRIFKSCFIYFQNFVNYVYYVVLDHNLKEVGRFIEVEVNKDQVGLLEAAVPGSAMATLKQAEQILESIGISPQNRLKKSLFELYKKEGSK